MRMLETSAAGDKADKFRRLVDNWSTPTLRERRSSKLGRPDIERSRPQRSFPSYYNPQYGARSGPSARLICDMLLDQINKD
jgi:hypothetical protein